MCRALLLICCCCWRCWCGLAEQQLQQSCNGGVETSLPMRISQNFTGLAQARGRATRQLPCVQQQAAHALVLAVDREI
jgi:hypothetical protein